MFIAVHKNNNRPPAKCSRYSLWSGIAHYLPFHMANMLFSEHGPFSISELELEASSQLRGAGSSVPSQLKAWDVFYLGVSCDLRRAQSMSKQSFGRHIFL